jgi:3-hydroxyisobutyrate dehydrogenase
LPLGKNLVGAGHRVRGYVFRAAAVEAHVAAGGQAAGSAAEAAKGADVLVLMVVDAAQAEAALFAGGALAAMAPNGIVILGATCAPSSVEAIAARVVESGHGFVDAPVSGGVKGAATATLTIMAAAPDVTFARAKPFLDALGDKVFRVGDRPGQGATAKAVNQLLCGVHIAVAAEALSLAEKVGIDPKVALEIVGGSAASSWMLRDRGPRMLEDDPPVTSAVDIFVKDLGIVLAAGTGARAALPLAAVAHQLFLAVSGQGKGSTDDSQVIRAYRALAGKE